MYGDFHCPRFLPPSEPKDSSHKLLHSSADPPPPSNEVIRQESRIIQQITHKNGLKSNISNLIQRRRLRHLLSLPENRGPDQPPLSNDSQWQRWIRLPFLGKPSYKLERELKKMDLKVGFYPLVTLGQAFCSKDPILPQNKSGVYLLNCGRCKHIMWDKQAALSLNG